MTTRSGRTSEIEVGRITYQALESCTKDILQRTGMSTDHASIVAEFLAMTDLRGVHSHGAAMLAGYVTKLQNGEINPRGEAQVATRYGAVAVIDGDGCMGHLAAVIAMRLAMKLAKEFGIGAVAVHRTNHCGAAGHFARLALEQDMVGLIMATAMPTMAPSGGRDRALGMNPIGVAIPAGDQAPVVLDAAFAAAARGKIVLAHQAGRALPEGWALDRDGNPTTDPAAALGGLIQPIGDFKGSGLAVVFGLMASAFAGAAFGADLGEIEVGPVASGDGLLAIALDPGAFDAAEAFGTRVSSGVRRLRDSRPSPTNDRVRLPGDRAAEFEARAREAGILLPEATRAELADLCVSLGVDVPAGLVETDRHV